MRTLIYYQEKGEGFSDGEEEKKPVALGMFT